MIQKNHKTYENLAIDTEPAWSPDGKIIFTSDRSGSPQIYENVRTKLKRRLTTEGNYNARASFDKNKIIFVHRSNTDFNIAKLDLRSRI